MDGARPLRRLAFWRRVGLFRDFADVEIDSCQEIVLEERDLVLAPGLYFCKRSSGPPSSRGGVRIWRMVGYNTRSYQVLSSSYSYYTSVCGVVVIISVL